jgi:hypothetical protein
MLKKRGQVTIFVIIAILIVAGIVLFFYIQNKTSSLTPTIPKNIQPINDFVVNCIKETAEKGLVKIGQQGGYFFIPSSVLQTEVGTPYLIYGKNSALLTKEEVESSLSNFMNEELGFCIRYFKDFPQFEINQSHFETKVNISENRVNINVDYPLVIKKDESIYTLKNFDNIQIPVRLGTIYSAVNEIVQEEIGHTNSICLSCLSIIGKQNGLAIEAFDYNNNSVIFSIKDYSSQINNQTYEFIFAKYEI